VADALKSYNIGRIWDEELLDIFQEQFEGWTKEMFTGVYFLYLRELKRILRNRGVNTGPITGNVSDQLVALLERPRGDLPDYDEAYLKKSEIEPRSQAYAQHRALRGEDGPQRQETASAGQNADNPRPSRENNQSEEERQQQAQPGTDRPGEVPRRSQTPMEQGNYPQPNLNRPQTREPETAYDPYSTLPPHHYDNERCELNLIGHFSKTFEKEKRYNGEPYNLLDDTLQIFFDICYHAGIRPGQFHAVFPRILTGHAESYYVHYCRKDAFDIAYDKIKTHFDTEVNHTHYYTDWTTTTFSHVRRENSEKTLQEVLRILLDKLALCQRALGKDYEGDAQLRTTVMRACRGVPELELALFKPAPRCEEMFSDLRSSIESALHRGTQQLLANGHSIDDQYYLDRRYNNSGGGRGSYRGGFRGFQRGSFRGSPRGSYRGSNRGQNTGGNSNRRKICYVCKKEGCWSKNHTKEEQEKAKAAYVADCSFTGASPAAYVSFLVEYEGYPEVEEVEDDYDEGYDHNLDSQYYAAEEWLTDQAFLHQITGEDIYGVQKPSTPANQFLLEDRYSRTTYQGILPDTGAANVSTVGKDQCMALQREDPTVMFDTSTAGRSSVKFGKGTLAISIGTATVHTEIGAIGFEVLDAPTPFLMCLADMDRLSVYFDNTTNELVQGTTRTPVVRKWGHPWFHLGKAANAVFLTEVELRRLHRRFGHPTVDRLTRMLRKAGHEDVDEDILRLITKFCHHCQVNGTAPTRFKFTLKDDHEFNYEIIVDVMYPGGRNVLHIVDASTAFQGARFLPSMSAKDTWEALRMLWIDTYQGPPDIITHDAGTNFASNEFRSEARMMGITCKQIPTEAHWSIGKLERYHTPLRRAYDILRAELAGTTNDDAILQMAVKAVNDTAGPDGLVPTLLVFGAYPRITTESPPSPATVKRGEAIQKAMKALRRAHAERQVNDALNTRNGPTTEDILSLPLQSEVIVWREKDGWHGPYKVAAIQGHKKRLPVCVQLD
jgi:hypothetical protein